MIKAVGISGFLLLMGLLAFPELAATSASAADFGKPGPFAVGVREFAITDSKGEEQLETYVWYPATGPVPDKTAAVRPTPDAPPAATGSYPLVVMISGLRMSGNTNGDWGELLASHGFVVFASTYDHYGSEGIGRMHPARAAVFAGSLVSGSYQAARISAEPGVRQFQGRS